MRIRRQGQWFSILAGFLAGCGEGDPGLSPPPARVAAAPTLIDEEARTHHFGPVVSRPGRTLHHVYRLVNPGPGDVTIVDVVNRKPCCGSVAFAGTTLRPGEGTGVEITLRVAGTFGDVTHEAEVITEPALADEPIRLLTRAKAHPALRVEDESSGGPPSLLDSDSPRQVAFRVVAHGTADDPPVDLDRAELGSSLAVAWEGASRQEDLGDGLVARSRRFSATLDPSHLLGPQSTSVTLRSEGGSLLEHTVHWEVVPVLSAAPKLIALVGGRTSYRVLIRAHDERPFRIARIECDVPGIRAESEGQAAAQHVVSVRVEGTPRLSKDRDVLTVRTDHPARALIEVPIIAIE